MKPLTADTYFFSSLEKYNTYIWRSAKYKIGKQYISFPDTQ